MAKRPKLCLAEAAGMGSCTEPVKDAYFCERHWLEWDERGNRTAGERAASEAVA